MVGGDTADSLGPNAAFSSVAGAGRGSEEVAHLARSPILWGSSLFPMPPSNPPTELSEMQRKTAYIPRWRGEASCQVAAAGNARGAKMWELVYQTC